MKQLSQVLFAVIQRDLLIYSRHKGEWAGAILFFLIVASLFPMALDPKPETLIWLAAGIIWVSALLATILSQEGLFRSDHQDGLFEQLLISPHPVPLLVFAKMLADWLATGLPLILVTPLIGFIFNLPFERLLVLTTTLLMGTPTLSALGLVGVSLTLSMPRGGIMLAVLILPLYVPILILGAQAVTLSAEGLPIQGYLALMAAIAIMAIVLAPLAVSSALKVNST